MLFLRASERRGVETPKGAFAVAKMFDAMLSQQEWWVSQTLMTADNDPNCPNHHKDPNNSQ